MALKNIIQKIKQEGEVEIKKIERETEEEIKKLEKIYQDKFDMKKKQILEQKRKEIQQAGDQIIFQEKLKNNTIILDKKRKIIDRVYQEVLNKLSKLSNKEYIGLISKLISHLPQIEKGEIIPSKNKKAQTEEALQKSKRDFNLAQESADIKGGFIFVSDKINIDNSFEELINKIKSETEAEVAKILFAYDKR